MGFSVITINFSIEYEWKMSISEFAQDISCWINRCNDSAVLDMEHTSQPEMLSFKTSNDDLWHRTTVICK